jgi:AcrR family transcriptional regulator
MTSKAAAAHRPKKAKASQQEREGATPMSRSERMRLQTRMKLVAAAKSVMARAGVEGATIAEIADEADVGFGSFYNHFTSKEEIAEAVFASQTEDLAKVLDMARQSTPDPALAVSFVQRLIIRKAYLDPVWGWFVVRAQGALPQMQKTFKERAAATLGRGTKEGRFNIPAIDTAIAITLGGLIAVIRNMLEQGLSDSVGAEFADLMLRLYGVAPREAASLSRQPLPAQLLAALHQAAGGRAQPVLTRGSGDQ